MLGIAMRAAATNFTMARMLGVPANLIISSAAFAISGFLGAAWSRILWIAAHRVQPFPASASSRCWCAFIATVIGGIRRYRRR